MVCCLFKPNRHVPPNPGWSDSFGSDSVNKLFRGCKRHCPDVPFRFVALVDAFRPNILPGVEQILFEDSPEFTGWLSLMEMFRSDIAAGPIITWNLDVVVCGDISEIVAARPRCALVRDPLQWRRFKAVANPVAAYSRAQADRFWMHYRANQKRLMEQCQIRGRFSEMAYLRKFAPKTGEYLDGMFPNQIVSYKAHWRRRREKFLPTARIVYFHGLPKMPVEDEHLIENWQ